MKVMLNDATSYDISHDIIDRPAGIAMNLTDLHVDIHANHSVLETSIFAKIEVETVYGPVEFEANETTEDLVLSERFNQYALYLKDMKVVRSDADESALERLVEKLEEACVLLTFVSDN